MRHRRLLHVVPRGQRSENAPGGGTVATDVRVTLDVGTDAELPVVVRRERVRHFRPGQHVDDGQFGGHGVHVADGVAAERTGTRWEQIVVGTAGHGGVRRRIASGAKRARRRRSAERPSGGVRQV